MIQSLYDLGSLGTVLVILYGNGYYFLTNYLLDSFIGSEGYLRIAVIQLASLYVGLQMGYFLLKNIFGRFCDVYNTSSTQQGDKRFHEQMMFIAYDSMWDMDVVIGVSSFATSTVITLFVAGFGATFFYSLLYIPIYYIVKTVSQMRYHRKVYTMQD